METKKATFTLTRRFNGRDVFCGQYKALKVDYAYFRFVKGRRYF